MLLFSLVFFLSICAFWLPRGLPDTESVSFYPAAFSSIQDRVISKRFYKKGPLEAYNADEGVILNALSNMNPARGDFNPRFFNYSTFFIYQVGAELALLEKLNLIKLIGDQGYYFSHPEEIKKMYLAGRLLSVIYGLLTIILVYKLIKLLSGERFRAGFGVLILCLMPNWIRESVFMIPNTAQAFFMTAAVYLTFKNRRQANLKPLVFSGIFAGLAAGCKYPGGAVAVLPAVVFIFNAKKAFSTKLLGAVAILAAAGAAFFVTTPYCLFDRQQFSSDIVFVVKSFPETASAFYRIYPVLFAAGPGILLIFLAVLLNFFKNLDKTKLLFLGWLLLNIWVPVVSNSTYMRYWTPVLPAMAVFAAVFFEAKMLKLAFYFLIPFSFLYTLHFNVLTQMDDDPRIQASRWIEANIPAGSPIAARRMHFDMPVINNEKYRVVEESAPCPSPGAEWFVKRDRFPASPVCPGLKLVKTFSNRPFLFGIDKYKRDLGDLAYTHLKISIYRAE